jgi:hypothetical protein
MKAIDRRVRRLEESLLPKKMRRWGAWSRFFGNDAVAAQKRAGAPRMAEIQTPPPLGFSYCLPGFALVGVIGLL